MKELNFEQLKETLYYEQLPNGLQVYILPKKGFSKTYVTFTTKYGSIDRTFQPRGKEEWVTVPDGIAHFLEHKMFEKEDEDVFQRFSAYGASANAFTSYTRTSYLFSTTENLYENTKVLLDFVQQPYFTEQTVEKEKGIIAQEITMYEDHPDWRLYTGTIQNMYEQHPVHIDIAGTVASIQEITADHLYECYETFYHPSNMILFVIGAVDPAEMMSFVKRDQASKSFEEPADIQRYFPTEPTAVKQKDRVERMDVSKPKFCYGLKCSKVDVSGKEMLQLETAVQIVLDLLFGRTSEFYKKAYDQALIDESFGYDFTLENGFGFALISSDTEHPEKLQQAIATTLQEVAVHWPITTTDLERAKKRRIGQFLRSLNSIEFIANQFTHYQFNQMNLFDLLPTLEQLKMDQLQQAFETIVREESQTVFTILPADDVHA